MSLSESYPRPMGRYILVQHLARGGMGDLHLAVTGTPGFQKLCVLKQLLPHLVDDESVQRFIDEATVMVKLSHGNLVPVLESGTIAGTTFMAMEYVEGHNLREIWKVLEERRRPFPLNLALYVVKEICRGLHFVHTHGNLGLVHRDVSPPNVLLSYAGEVKLADFGLAISATRLQRTSPGILLGKLPYMSPEQARGEQVDLRADIYSTGVILWELITGKRLFPPLKTLGEDMARAVKPVIEPPSRINPQLPAPLDAIALRALAPSRDERYPEAESLRKDLATLLAEVDVTTDATALQRFLEELYGPEATQARQRRKQLLDSMAPRIAELLAAPAPAAEARAPASAAPFDAGTILNDKYRIDRLLGEGGMGRVYQALHMGIGRDVALKVLMREFNQMDDVVARFRREAWAANRIAHPNIVEILDSGTTEDGQLYYAMEYLAGIDLGELLRREGRLKADRATRIALQICQGLSAAHEAEVIHRDLKPENIFIVSRPDEPEFVKIVDFGVARMPHGTEKTLPGLAMGTPEYMAPEQAERRGHDHRVDIYSMGVVLYEMLTGTVPFKGNTYNEVLYRKVSEKLIPPRERGVELPDELQQLVLSTLENNPDHRPQTMQQVAYELRKLLEGRAAAVAQLLRLPESMAARWSGPAPSTQGSYEVLALTEVVRRPASSRSYFWPLVGAALLVTLAAAFVLLLRHPGGARQQAPPARVDRGTARPTRDAARPAPDAPRADTSVEPDREPGLKAAPKRVVRVKPKKKTKRLDGTLNPFRPRRR